MGAAVKMPLQKPLSSNPAGPSPQMLIIHSTFDSRLNQEERHKPLPEKHVTDSLRSGNEFLKLIGASGTPIELASAFLSGFRGFPAKMTRELRDSVSADVVQARGGATG